jgi:hypothetical protein
LTRIRSLSIYWELESTHYNKVPGAVVPNQPAWDRSWAALGQMSGLRRLHIVIASRSRPWTDSSLQQWEGVCAGVLSGIRTITAPSDFVVTLPDRGCSTALDVGDSRCVFELPAEALSNAEPT